MIERTKGEMIDIMGLECWLPVPPVLEEIDGFALPEEEQKFRRTPLPDIAVSDIDIVSGEEYSITEIIDWDAARREEVIMQTGGDPWKLDKNGVSKVMEDVIPDPTFVFPLLEAFRIQEMERCHPLTGGYWCMIKGKPYYLTPFHYFYVNWWKLNTGYPDWRWIDALRFYHWQYTWQDQRSTGEIEASKRGDGKTYRVTAKAYLVTIYKKHCHSGIQSKTDDDAEAVFLDKMAEPYKDLPDFFIPINDHGTFPKSGFNFFAPSKSGKLAASMRILQKQALRSKIDFRAAKVEAYDGANINGVLIRDEEGKTKLVDVWERHSTTRDSVYRDGKMHGKIASTTTVEKWEAGGENFKKLWDFSDPEYRDEGTGETFTGLYKIWFPAYLTEYQDDWGFPDEEYARRIQAARRRQYITDADALQKYQLQYPWTEMEMFQTSGITCQYNLTELRALEVMINDPSFNIVRIGNFLPVDGIGSKIKFHDDTLNGRFHVLKFMEPGKDNQWRETTRDGQKTFIPLNEGGVSAGFDPTKSYNNPRKDRSMAGGVFMEKEAFWNPDQTPNFMCDYAWKPDDPELAYLDMLYAAMYYGCPFLPESNLGIGSFMKKLGCDAFLLRRPEITYTDPDKANVDEVGLPATTSSNDILLKKAKSWHANHGWKIKLPRIIRDSIGFNPAERTKFDVEVAKQLAIVAAEKVEKQQPSEVKMEKMFASFNQAGHTGVMN